MPPTCAHLQLLNNQDIRHCKQAALGCAQAASQPKAGVQQLCQQQVVSGEVAQRLQANVSMVDNVLQHFLLVVHNQVPICPCTGRSRCCPVDQAQHPRLLQCASTAHPI